MLERTPWHRSLSELSLLQQSTNTLKREMSYDNNLVMVALSLHEGCDTDADLGVTTLETVFRLAGWAWLMGKRTPECSF